MNDGNKKKLSDLTLEELWLLFPINLVENNPLWSKWYHEEKKYLIKLITIENIESINHIGSTNIKRIKAKPIIDILIEIKNNNLEKISKILSENGYLEMNKTKKRISLNKGYTINGFSKKVFHIHLRYPGDNDEIYFIKYLNNHEKVAKEYEMLKEKLKVLYSYNRDAYTDGKKEFVKKYTEIAKKQYMK